MTTTVIESIQDQLSWELPLGGQLLKWNIWETSWPRANLVSGFCGLDSIRIRSLRDNPVKWHYGAYNLTKIQNQCYIFLCIMQAIALVRDLISVFCKLVLLFYCCNVLLSSVYQVLVIRFSMEVCCIICSYVNKQLWYNYVMDKEGRYKSVCNVNNDIDISYP
jgi:hypothetical protein